jgi:hypothetical protein
MKRASMHSSEINIQFAIEVEHTDLFERVHLSRLVWDQVDDELQAPEVEEFLHTNCVHGRWAYEIGIKNVRQVNNPILKYRVIVHNFYFEDKKDATLFRLAFG